MRPLVIALAVAATLAAWTALTQVQADAMAKCQVKHSIETCIVEAGQ